MIKTNVLDGTVRLCVIYQPMHDLLQQARDLRGLTNAEISRILGVSESLISKVMSGARRPSGELLPKLCRILQIPEPIEQELAPTGTDGPRRHR